MQRCKSERKHLTEKLAKPALCLLVAMAFAQSANAGGPLGAGANVGAGVQAGAGATLPRAGVNVGGSAAMGTGTGGRIIPPSAISGVARGGSGTVIGTGANAVGGGTAAAGTTVGAGAGSVASTLDQEVAANPNVRAEENANGQFISDRLFGLDRAQERRSEQGAEHEKASDAPRKRVERPVTPGAAASSNASTRSAAGASARAPRESSAEAGSNAATNTDASARK